MFDIGQHYLVLNIGWYWSIVVPKQERKMYININGGDEEQQKQNLQDETVFGYVPK